MSHMEFTLSVSNCLQCSMCPQDKLGAAYKSGKRVMLIEDFHEILGKLPSGCQVHFSGFSEPFLNPNAGGMMAVAKDKGREVHLYTTLVGFKPESSTILKNFPPNVCRIHVPDGKHLVYNEEKWVEYLERFLLSGVQATYMAMGTPSDFIKRQLAIRNIVLDLPLMLNRGGNLAHVPVRTIDGPMHCTMNRWHSNVCLPNGDVYGCCMDYSLSVYLGNLIRQPYNEINYEAEKWKMNMEKRAEGICARCEWAQPK